MDNWDDVATECLQEQVRLSQLSDEAEACRSSLSTSDDEVDEPFPQVTAGKPWWVARIRHHAREHQVPPRGPQVRVVSACTGASAESFVLEVWSCQLGNCTVLITNHTSE